jgi:hypothetical protein
MPDDVLWHGEHTRSDLEGISLFRQRDTDTEYLLRQFAYVVLCLNGVRDPDMGSETLKSLSPDWLT